MLAPLRAPNRYWAARPPDPWHTGIAPNQPPIRFMSATLMPIEVTPGAGMWGRRSAARYVTCKGRVSGTLLTSKLHLKKRLRECTDSDDRVQGREWNLTEASIQSPNFEVCPRRDENLRTPDSECRQVLSSSDANREYQAKNKDEKGVWYPWRSLTYD